MERTSRQWAIRASGGPPILSTARCRPQLDGVSVTVNGKPAYIYYISPTKVNILTPPGAMPESVAIQFTVNGSASAPINVPTQSVSPSFFVFNGGPYVAAEHANYTYLGPANLYLGLTTPAKPGETVLLYANGFGATSVPVVYGSSTQSGTLSPLPMVTIGGIAATVSFAGLVAPGEHQFNVVIPANAQSGDNTLTATYSGVTTSPVALITIQGTAPTTSVTYYVAPYGSDSWSGTLARADQHPGHCCHITALTSNGMIAPSYWIDPKSGNDYMLTVQYSESQVKNLNDLRAIPLRGPRGFRHCSFESG